MDIGSLGAFNGLNSGTLKADKKEKIKKKSFGLFSEKMKEAEGAADRAVLDGSETLEKLMDDVFVQGEKLVNDPALGNLKAYKKSVGLFFKYVIKNGLSYAVKEGRLNPVTFERKCYSLISVVNSKLDSIARGVLTEQRAQLNLLETVEEINGLIVDLVS